MVDNNQLDRLEAVYYPQQVPRSLASLTLMGLIFDRVYFPGVYMPPAESFDPVELQKEIERLKAVKPYHVEHIQLVNCMIFAGIRKYVDDFCVFAGTAGGTFGIDGQTPQMALALDELIFGPPPPDFIPTPMTGFVKALPGDDVAVAQVSAPGALYYPANALLYSTKNEIPLINDDPSLPVPGIPGDARGNAKLLSTILAIESVRLVLPKVRALSPQELMDFRQETAIHVRPFRIAMLRLARELNAAINSDMPLNQVQKAAKFLVETTVYPELKELESILHDPGKPWYRRAVDMAKAAPELATGFLTLPMNIALAKLLGTVAHTLADLRDEQRDRESTLSRGGLHYLLKLKEHCE
jgi:hypothetical protein